MLDIDDLADRAPYQLSGGEKKRVAIASVLVMNPEVLLFDEPTAALDPRTQQWLIELIVELNRAGKTIVLATHDLDILDVVADRCLVFSEEHRIVAEGPPHRILADRDLLLEREPDPRAHATSTRTKDCTSTSMRPAITRRPRAPSPRPWWRRVSGTGSAGGGRAGVAAARDGEVREVGDEPVVTVDQVLQRLGLLQRQRVVAPAVAAREVDVLGLLGAVVLGPRLEVRVLQDAHLFQQSERAVDGGGVHPRHLALDLAGDGRGGDVALRPHDLGDDRAPLGRHAQTTRAQQFHHIAEVRLGPFHRRAV